MPLYLTQYIGRGTRADPFMPRGLHTPGASAIDLRADCTCLDGQGVGYALLWVPIGFPTPIGAITLADDYGDRLTLPQRRRLNSLLRLDFARDRTIQDAVETILLHPRGHFGGLRPAHGRIEAWLGSGEGKRRWVDLPVVAGGSISDNFNRANETPIASPWTQLSGSTGNVNLATNAITHASAGDCFYYYSNASGWNANQSSQFLYADFVVNSDWGPAVRIGSGGGFSGYFYSQFGSGRTIGKWVSGSFSSVEAAAGGTDIANTYKLDVSGSTLSYYDNGSANANSPATDSSLTTAGNGPGVFFYDTGGSVDDFLATGEITAGSSPQPNLLLLGVGGLVRTAALVQLPQPMGRRRLFAVLGALLGRKR